MTAPVDGAGAADALAVHAGETGPAGRWGGLAARVAGSPLLRSSAAYVGSNLLNRAVPFLLIPVLTRYLSPADVGVTAMWAAAVGLAVPLVGMSTDTAIARRYFDREQIDFAGYVANCMYVLLVSGLLLAAVALPLARPLGALLSIPPAWVWTVVVAAAGRYVVAVVLSYWRVRQKPGPYAAFSFVMTALGLGLSVFLVVGLGWGWQGRVSGELVSLAVLGALALLLLARGGWLRRAPVDRTHLSDALRYGGGLIPHVYGGLLISTTDRLFVTHLVGVDETGLYVVGVQIAMLVGVLQQSFNQAWAPWLFGALKRDTPGTLRRVRRLTRVYNAVILALALGLAAVTPWLLGFFVGPEFRGAAPFVLWLALAGAFEGMYKMVVNQVFYAGRTHRLATITLVTGLLNVVFAYALIRLNGAVGAAQATALSMFVSYLLTARLSARVERGLLAEAKAA